MRSIFIGALLIGSGWLAAAQQAEPLLFDEKVHDFGTLREEEGAVETDFTFTNNSGRTITILQVQPSCGCTTPGWTREPIAPGKKGAIKASFNPLGRPGFFNKTLTVTTDLPGPPVVLQIKGNVTTQAMENDLSRLTANLGSLKMKSSSLNLGKVFINQAQRPLEFPIFNAGESTLRFLGVNAPPYLRVQTPDALEPQQRGTLQVWLDAKAKGQYGFLSESFELTTDDALEPQKRFSVFATVEEYFAPLTEEETRKAPVLVLAQDQLEMGAVAMGSSIKRTITLRNAGRQELVIRAVQPNCPCLVVQLSATTIKPGQEASLSIELKGEGRRGTQHKAVTLYSTDPVNPVQRLALTAQVQ
jgi:hypothetical protein